MEEVNGDFVLWLLNRLYESDHCCLTGDCPCNKKTECVNRLVADFRADQAGVPGANDGTR